MYRDEHGRGRWHPRGRVAKARKIEELLRSERDLEGGRILDVGTGSGIIAAALARAAGPSGEVIGADVLDQRQVRAGFTYVPVTGTRLPFEDSSFDIVVSNHAIEHVGGVEAQLDHLREVRRVLADDGVCYLATPNRWTLVEPHFRMPFLSWVPEGMRDRYVRALRRGAEYDCHLLTRRQVAGLFRAAGLAYVERTLDAMRVMAEVEPGSVLRRRLLTAPRALHRALLPLVPTMIFLARRTDGRS